MAVLMKRYSRCLWV